MSDQLAFISEQSTTREAEAWDIENALEKAYQTLGNTPFLQSTAGEWWVDLSHGVITPIKSQLCYSFHNAEEYIQRESDFLRFDENGTVRLTNREKQPTAIAINKDHEFRCLALRVATFQQTRRILKEKGLVLPENPELAEAAQLIESKLAHYPDYRSQWEELTGNTPVTPSAVSDDTTLPKNTAATTKEARGFHFVLPIKSALETIATLPFVKPSTADWHDAFGDGVYGPIDHDFLDHINNTTDYIEHETDFLRFDETGSKRPDAAAGEVLAPPDPDLQLLKVLALRTLLFIKIRQTMQAQGFIIPENPVLIEATSIVKPLFAHTSQGCEAWHTITGEALSETPGATIAEGPNHAQAAALLIASQKPAALC